MYVAGRDLKLRKQKWLAGSAVPEAANWTRTRRESLLANGSLLIVPVEAALEANKQSGLQDGVNDSEQEDAPETTSEDD